MPEVRAAPARRGALRVVRPAGEVDFFDNNPFVLALTSQTGYEQQYPGCRWLNADCNGDGEVDFFDINAFVALLTA